MNFCSTNRPLTRPQSQGQTVVFFLAASDEVKRFIARDLDDGSVTGEDGLGIDNLEGDNKGMNVA